MIIGVVPDNTPLSSLPGTTISRVSGIPVGIDKSSEPIKLPGNLLIIF